MVSLTLFSAPFRGVEVDYFAVNFLRASVWRCRKPPAERLGGRGKFESGQNVSLSRCKSRGTDDSTALIFFNDDCVALDFVRKEGVSWAFKLKEFTTKTRGLSPS
jgi:hypothetical protein